MEKLQQHIGYHFKTPALLTRALTHPSLAKQENNQRLEFLGDAVIGLVVAHIIYDLFPHEQEGDLARRQAGLIRGETLTQVARDIGLGEALNVALCEVQSNGRSNSSNLEDAMEALIGAIYLDGGLEAAKNFIVPRWSELAKNVIIPPKDAKTALQEFAQGRGLPLPSYKLLDTKGSAHAPIFTVEVTVQGFEPATAQAASKRTAEQQAAKNLLEILE